MTSKAESNINQTEMEQENSVAFQSAKWAAEPPLGQQRYASLR